MHGRGSGSSSAGRSRVDFFSRPGLYAELVGAAVLVAGGLGLLVFGARGPADAREVLFTFAVLLVVVGLALLAYLDRRVLAVQLNQGRGTLTVIHALRRNHLPLAEVRYVGLRTYDVQRRGRRRDDGGGEVIHRWGAHLVGYGGANRDVPEPSADAPLTDWWRYVEGGQWLLLETHRGSPGGVVAALAQLTGLPCLFVGEDNVPRVTASPQEIARLWDVYGHDL